MCFLNVYIDTYSKTYLLFGKSESVNAHIHSLIPRQTKDCFTTWILGYFKSNDAINAQEAQ